MKQKLIEIVKKKHDSAYRDFLSTRDDDKKKERLKGEMDAYLDIIVLLTLGGDFEL